MIILKVKYLIDLTLLSIFYLHELVVKQKCLGRNTVRYSTQDRFGKHGFNYGLVSRLTLIID